MSVFQNIMLKATFEQMKEKVVLKENLILIQWILTFQKEQ